MTSREAFLEILVRQIPAVLWAVDRDLRFTFSEGAGLKELGLKPGEVVGRSLHEYFGTRDPSFAPLAAHLEALAGRSRTYESAWLDRIHQCEVEPLLGADGSVQGVLGIAVDVSAHRRAEEKATFQASLLDRVQSAILTTDRDLRLTFLNSFGERLLGWSGEEARGRSVVETFLPSDQKELAELVRRQVEAEGWWEGEFRPVRKDGKTLAVSSSVTALRGRDGSVEGFVVVSHDLTRRREEEQARRVAEERYRTIFENAVEGIFQTTPDGHILAANPALARMFGYASPEELVRCVGDVAAQHFADPARREEWKRLLEESGVLENFEYEIVRRDGQRVWLSENVRAVRNAEGRVLHYEGMVEDVTERRRLEEHLRQSQKMEAVGRLAGGVAHDFNNILTVMAGYSDLVLEKLEGGSPLRRHVEEIRKAAGRAAALTGQLLAFSRRQVLAPREVDLNETLADMERMLRRLIGEDVRLTIRAGADPSWVRVDPGQISQVVINLAANARDAMPRGGSLSLETLNERVERPSPRPGAVPPGAWVLLAVTDDGEGFSREALDHLFEPFYTTKARGRGVGLGLATVYGIVRQSGGHIQVESTRGRGTRFRIWLPQADRPAAPGPAAAEPPGACRGSEVVLVAEDEAPIRDLVRGALEERGYRVLPAADGEEALEIARRRSGPIDLLVTDVVMPRMGGGALARALQDEIPAMKVLFVSGYTDDALVHHGVSEQDQAFLRKPFTPEQLLAKIREVLDGA